MKQKLYQISGDLTAEQVETIKSQLPLVEQILTVDIFPSEGEHAGYVTVEWSSEPTDDALIAWENAVDELLHQNGDLSLVRPALVAHYVAEPTPPKQGKKIGLGAAIGTVVTAVVLAVLLTFAVTIMLIQRDAPTQVVPGTGETEGSFEQLDALDRLFRVMSPLELNDQELLDAVLKAYVSATGDAYAQYFTEEEYAAYRESQSGQMVGIGISVVEDTITVGGTEYIAIAVINVFPDSPAEEAGVFPGDYIMYVGSGEERVLVHSIGYEQASALMVGEAGTAAEFEVFRPSESEPSGYESVMISAIRREIQSRTVQFRICDTDDNVGIIRITSFDNTTPTQFAEAVESLKEQGCDQFIFDLRYNPGGMLTSVVDMLTYFTEVGDTLISIKDKNNNEEIVVVSDRVDSQTGKLLTGSGTLGPSDIGKYRNLNFVVLTNEYTASAAELFAANIRDYELGALVGTTTFGKGSIQTFISLKAYGYDGVLKITYGYYYPPCGDGYHDEGIEPHVVEPLSEEASDYKNFNLLPHDKDNQLQKAIEIMNAKG